MNGDQSHQGRHLHLPGNTFGIQKLRLKAAGNTMELLGSEDVNGSPAYKLRVTPKGGISSIYFLDAGTFLPVKTIAKVSIMGRWVEGETSRHTRPRADSALRATATATA